LTYSALLKTSYPQGLYTPTGSDGRFESMVMIQHPGWLAVI
jgi:hypothetical protein